MISIATCLAVAGLCFAVGALTGALASLAIRLDDERPRDRQPERACREVEGALVHTPSYDPRELAAS